MTNTRPRARTLTFFVALVFVLAAGLAPAFGQARIVGPDVPIIDPAMWDEIDQNALFFGTSATLAYDPRAGEERLFVLTHSVFLSLELQGDHYAGVAGNRFEITNPDTGWTFDHCGEDAALFILPPEHVETPFDQIPDLLNDENAIRTNPCEPRPDMIPDLGWHYGPGTLVDFDDTAVSGKNLAFIAASKSPDAAIFSEIVLLVSDVEALGTVADKFRTWTEVPLFNVSQALENDGLLIPEVILAREPALRYDGGNRIRWHGFAQVWDGLPSDPDLRVGTAKIIVDYDLAQGTWLTWLFDPSPTENRWRGLDSSSPATRQLDFVPEIMNIGIPKDYVYNPLVDRWELWLQKPFANHSGDLPPGCVLDSEPYRHQVSPGVWVDDQRGLTSPEIVYREVDRLTLALGNEVPLQSDYRAATPDYALGRQGTGILFLDGQAFMYSAHRDRNICTLPASGPYPRTVSQWWGLYTTIEPMDYLDARPVIGEVGMVTTGHVPKRVQLSRSYDDPVVLALPISFAGGETALPRITSVEPDAFTVYVHEAPDKNGVHSGEAISYVVLEAGRWQLADGTRLEVGSVGTNATVGKRLANAWASVPFASPFAGPPIILSQVQSNNDPTWVGTRQTAASASGFQVALEGDESRTTAHGAEQIGWMAIEPGGGTWSGLLYEAGRRDTDINHKWRTIATTEPFSSAGPMRFLAALSTYLGVDSSHLRYRNLGASGVDVKIQEDTVFDSEQGHVDESVDYLFFGADGQLRGRQQ